jgi:hypothetical protein
VTKALTVVLPILLSLSAFSGVAVAAANRCGDVLLGPRPWFAKISPVRIEQTLRSGRIVQVEDLKQALVAKGKSPVGSTEGVKLVTFEDGTQGVWKPGSTTPSGEVAAYQLAQAVAFPSVPPTVLRELSGTVGSLQYFVKTPWDLPRLSWYQRQNIWSKVSTKQKSDHDIFNFVFGKWDRNWGNVGVDDDNALVSFDNSSITTRQMVRLGESPFLRLIEFTPEAKKAGPSGPFLFDEAILLSEPTKDDFVFALKEVGVSDQVERYWNWIQKAGDKTMKIVFWDNAIYIRPIGYSNEGAPIRPTVYSEQTLAQYRDLHFEKLRLILPADIFPDEALYEMLSRRDQILQASEAAQKIP